MTAPVRLHFTVARGELLNANDRLHWAVRARRTAALRDMAAWKWRATRHPGFDRAHINVEVTYPDHRRRDVDNLRPTVKALVDGITAEGALPDDNDRHVAGIDMRASNHTASPSLYLFEFTLTAQPERTSR